MAGRIAVEDGLEHVHEALRREGFEVTKITEGTMSHVSAAVVTGLSSNVLGDHRTQGNPFPVIEAAGMTAEEVVAAVQRRMQAAGGH